MSVPRIAVLVDLPREPAAGGHVKYWERIAEAAVAKDFPVDLTIYFSGDRLDDVLSPRVRFRYLRPVFSTSNLKFLPYVPAHTDLAPFHPTLAQELSGYDVIHATEGCFAFTRTAERVSQWSGIPLVTSFHTDTPAYAEVFTRQTITHIFGEKFGGWLERTFHLALREKTSKTERLKTHLRRCAAILAMRREDIILAESVTDKHKIYPMRLGVDKDLFSPSSLKREDIEDQYKIPHGKFVALFVGRIDAGKNVHVLAHACMEAVAKGVALHLVVAGLGPMSGEIKSQLGENVTLAGLLQPADLARLYASVDCLAITSDIEIGGMIGLEALACGCPVLVSRQSGMAQACGEPKAMQIIDSSIPAWAKALTDFAHDPERRTRMKAAALECRASHIAGWDNVLEEDFLPVWQSVRTRKGTS